MSGWVTSGSSCSLWPSWRKQHQVDNHVLAELHAVVERDFGNQQHRLGIVGIHMKDRASTIFATSVQ